MTDNQLLEAWVTRRSDPAFAELMRRYVDVVYSAALRQVRDPQLAEDVAQAVFLILARKASSLRRHAALAGWFFRTTRYVAACTLRSEARRHRLEQEAATMNAQAQTPDSYESTWTQIAPLLDEAIAALPRTDRAVVLLRYFQAKPMHSVGEQLGVSEEAAKKRVSRAVEKLKDFFVRRGITLSAALLAGALGRSAVQAAPAGLAARIAAAQASPAGPGAAAALAAAVLRQLFWLKVRRAAAFGAGGLALLLLVKALLPGSAPAQPPTATAQTPDTASTGLSKAGPIMSHTVRRDRSLDAEGGVGSDAYLVEGIVKFDKLGKSDTNQPDMMPALPGHWQVPFRVQICGKRWRIELPACERHPDDSSIYFFDGKDKYVLHSFPNLVEKARRSGKEVADNIAHGRISRLPFPRDLPTLQREFTSLPK